MVDLIDAQFPQVGQVIRGHLNRDLAHRDAAFFRFADQFVVDVGDVHHPSHFVAAVRQIPFDGVEDDRTNHVSNMGLGINRRPAQIHPHPRSTQRQKRLFGFAQRVVNTNGGLGGRRGGDRCGRVGGGHAHQRACDMNGAKARRPRELSEPGSIGNQSDLDRARF